MTSSTANQDNKALRRSQLSPIANTLIVASGMLLSRVLGLAREIVIAEQFGTTGIINAYQATFAVIDMIYLLVAGGALGSAFIPVFTEFLEQKRVEDAWRLVSGVLNVVLVSLLVTCILVAVLAEPLVAMTIGRGFDQPTRELTVSILRWMLLQPILLGLGGLSKATLESFNRFTLPAIGSNLYNLGIIGGALLAPWLGIEGLVYGVLLGAALFVIIQLPGLRSVGLRYDHRSGLAAPGVRKVWRLLAPRLFGQAAWQLNFVAITSFATHLEDGAVRANSIAYQLMTLPHGLIALSLGTVIFPQLARYYAADDRPAVRRLMLGALRAVLFLAIPASVLIGALSIPVIRLLFQHGEFDAASTILTAHALAPYALGLAAFAGAEIVVRTFYAMHDTRTPVYIGIAAMIFNVTLGWALIQLGWGLSGLTLAFSITSLIEWGILLYILRARLGGLGEGFVSALVRMLLAAFATGGVLIVLLRLSQRWLPFLRPHGIYAPPSDFLLLAIWLACAGAISALVYGGIAALLRLSELQAVLERTTNLFNRLRRGIST